MGTEYHIHMKDRTDEMAEELAAIKDLPSSSSHLYCVAKYSGTRPVPTLHLDVPQSFLERLRPDMKLDALGSNNVGISTIENLLRHVKEKKIIVREYNA